MSRSQDNKFEYALRHHQPECFVEPLFQYLRKLHKYDTGGEPKYR